MRDAGFLVGELKAPLLQEVRHERLYFIVQKFLRLARDDEVIRIADQVDLVALPLPARAAETLVEQSFQSIQGPIRQRRSADASLRSAFRRGEESVFLHKASLQPLPEDDPVHGSVGQQPS